VTKLLKGNRWRLLATAGAVAVLALIAAWFAKTAPELVDALGDFDARLLPAIALLVAVDYGLRFYRWRWLFGVSAGRKLPLASDANVFMAGTAMILTPGRAGELVKPLYAQRLYGVPFARTAPIPLVERIVDVAAMLSLAYAGAVVFVSPLLLLLAPLGAVVVLIASRQRRIVDTGTGMLRRKFRIDDFVDGLQALCRPGPLTMSFVLGLIAWGVECVAFGLVLIGAGGEANVALFAKASFIYPLATLAGTISFLPGGLGITEGGIAGMTQATLSLGAGPAAVASLVIRGAIVGLPVVLGAPSFLMLSRRSLKAVAKATAIEAATPDVSGECVPAA
jgi:uncharacterized protein (TIRG00374 family)